MRPATDERKENRQLKIEERNRRSLHDARSDQGKKKNIFSSRLSQSLLGRRSGRTGVKSLSEERKPTCNNNRGKKCAIIIIHQGENKRRDIRPSIFFRCNLLAAKKENNLLASGTNTHGQSNRDDLLSTRLICLDVKKQSIGPRNKCEA